MEIPKTHYKYGIVIDSGSSGSRIQIYKWPDPKYVIKHSDDPEIIESPPQISQEKNWSKKISPGISSYVSKPNKIWSDHYSELIQFAREIIPREKQSQTPIFVLSTAGMRLLAPKDRKNILKQTCIALKKNSNFLINDCENHVQTIDGETEGIYGWLGLNYLMGQLNKYQSMSPLHDSIGFMDMGGASSQIAFSPSSTEDIQKHREDISRVSLRNVNGLTQVWDVFVETWLGFGANEARKRYLTQLINLAAVNPGYHINDPCSPKDLQFTYQDGGKTYEIKGIGNYEMCIKTIYPLLMKNVPCKEEPCFFNGVHGPKLNFDTDKFVGISEYWYTTNDVFHSGGEYNYRIFNERVKEYCESDWPTILANSEKGQYSNLDADTFLRDACFKSAWVMNILHEGFELPRLDLEIPDLGVEGEEKEITKVHVPFKSSDSINGNELSWTLGKILLYASSEIPPQNKKDMKIGVYPASIRDKDFVAAGGINDQMGYDSDGYEHAHSFVVSFLILSAILFVVYHFTRHKLGFLKNRRFKNIKTLFYNLVFRIPLVEKVFQTKYDEIARYKVDISLEEGTLGTSQSSPNLTQLRTRSAINLSDVKNDDVVGHTNFMNRPFVVPKKGLFQLQNNSGDSLQRSGSAMGLPTQKERGF